MKRIAKFDEAIETNERIFEEGRQTEYYKKYDSYPKEVREKAREEAIKSGCTSNGVLRAYREAIEKEDRLFIIDGFDCSSSEDMVTTLESGNVKEFYEINQGTNLMEEIHTFAKAGWKFEAFEIYYERLQETRMALKFTKA